MTGIFIFVCDRGFVIVGEAAISEQLAFAWHLTRSRTIRRWGTSNGLAELIHGPKPETILDPICTRELPFRSVVDIIHVSEKGCEAWTKALS